MDRRDVMVSLVPVGQAPREVCLHFQHPSEGVFRWEGMLYLRAGKNLVCCRDNGDGNRLIEALLEHQQVEPSCPERSEDQWYQILTASGKEVVDAILKKHPLPENRKRIVIYFRMRSSMPQDLFTIFLEAAPMEENDHPVFTGHDSLALIKDMSARSENEIAEYAAAVIDTLASEGYTELQAGIGTEAENLYEIHRSYEEAADALNTGAGYRSGETLFRYSKQKLNRMMDAIPADSRARILNEFNTRCRNDIFSDEMIETIRVFFEHDLNITSSSRELFVHRNTLNYRLDKIKRDTGLDLRVFQDAVVFRLLLEINEMSKKPTE